MTPTRYFSAAPIKPEEKNTTNDSIFASADYFKDAKPED